MLTALVGTTIAPWQFFYLQAGFVEKRVGPKQYKHARLDVLVGSISCMVIVFFIIVCCAATLNKNGMTDITDAAQAAAALVPLAGRFAAYLFAFGLLNASLFAASILPLSTAHVICEGLGFEAGIDHKLKEAPAFYGLYTGLIIVGGGIHPPPQRPPLQNPGPLPSSQRRLAPGSPDLHPPPNQSPRPDGRTHQHLGLQPSSLGHQHNNDHPHPGARLRRDHAALQRRPSRHPNPFPVTPRSTQHRPRRYYCASSILSAAKDRSAFLCAFCVSAVRVASRRSLVTVNCRLRLSSVPSVSNLLTSTPTLHPPPPYASFSLRASRE